MRVQSLGKEDPWTRNRHRNRNRKWQPTSVFLSRKFYGQRSLAGYSPWDHKKSDNTTEHTHTPTGKLIWERRNQVVKWTRKGSTLTLIFKHLSSLCTSCVFMCVYVYVPISCKNYGPEMLPK